MKKSKCKSLIILLVAVTFLLGSSYLFLETSSAQKSADQTTVSLGAYHHSTVAAQPDKIEGYKTPRYSTEGVKKQEGGETCETATVIGSLPFNATGYTCDNVHDYDEVCPYTGSTAPDVVYSYTPGANETVNIDLWGSSYDTKLYVYEDNCVPPYYACNDDYYSNYVSAIMGLDIYAGHTYYIVVDGYGTSCGDYIILVETVEPCDVVCPGEGIPEDEPICEDNWEDIWNGGCNSDPQAFNQTLNCGDIICGTSGTYDYYGSNYRDTDWFRLVLSDPTTLSWKVVAEFPVLIFIIDAGSEDCVDYTILGNVTAEMCDTAFLSFDVPAGVYWLWVGPSVFEGVPCGKEYVGIVGCEVAETGACCYDLDPYTCTMTTPEDCTAPDYTFLGLGTDCGPPNPCLPGPDNDDCTGAIEVYPPDCPDVQTVYGTTIGATIDCPGFLDWPAVWYKCDLTYASNNLFIDFCAMTIDLYSVGAVIYDECPVECTDPIYYSEGVFVTCPNGTENAQLWYNSLPAGTYWIPIFVEDWGGNQYMDFGFYVCVEEGAGGPPNDNCVDAEPVGDVVDLAFCTDAATFDGGGTCMSSPNIWYLYTATCTGDATVSLCGSDYDTKLAVYDGSSCDPLSPEIECNDDFCGVQSQITYAAVEGNQYLIEVGGYSSNTGDGILNISCVGADQGACCNDFEPYDCQVLTEAECNALPDHTFLGIGTDCDPNPCVPGNTCDLPIEVELPADLPYMDRDQTTCGRGDNYDNTCLGYYDGGEDIIYELTVTEAVSVMITFDPKGTTWNGIALDGACPLDPSTCLYEYTQSGGSVHSFQYDLSVGTYYIQIDTWPSPDCIPDFDLTIDPLGPEIEVSPASFDVVLNPDPPNNTADETMNITNTGYEDLDYDIAEDPEVDWLSCLPTSGTVLPGLTDPVTVSFVATGMAVGDYYTDLVVTSNALTDPIVTVPVHLVVELPPDIDVISGMSMGVIPGCSMDKGMRIDNLGEGELRFEISVQAAPPTGKQADVLLVDDDHSAVFGEDFTDVVSYFTDALDANGYTYDIVEIMVEGGDGPDAATMADYPVVIWFTGESWRNEQTLTPTDEANLATYLDGGGNLFLSAMDYFYDRYGSAGSFSVGQFPYDYLGVTYVDQDAWWLTNPESGTATGMTGSLAEGMEFTLYDVYTPPPGGKDGLCIDMITHMGIDLFEITDPTPPTGVVACQYEVEKGFRVVYTTVDFAGLVDGVSPSTRAELMGNIMDWFLGAGCPFTVYPEEETIPAESFFDVVLTFDGTAFEMCSEDVLTCYLVISSNDPVDPVVSVQVDMWSGRGDVFDPTCLVDLGDVVFLVNFVLKGGPAPDPLCMGDCNRDGIDGDMEDLIYLINYLYPGTEPPPLATPQIHQPPTPLERK